MNKPKKPSSKPTDLRKKAEKKLLTEQERIRTLSAKDVQELVHELGTRQIELEMQVEEFQRAQADLEASRSRYADLYDFAPIGYFTLDSSHAILEVNLTAAKLLGIERSALLSKPFTAFVDKGDLQTFRAHCAAVAADRTRQTIELRLMRTDKTGFFALLDSIPVEDPKETGGAIRTAVSDITGRRIAEEAHQKSELRYRLLAENMLDGYAYCKMLYDDAGKPNDFVYLSVNKSFERLTGLKEAVGKHAVDLIPGIRESHPELIETYGRVARTGRTEKFEIEFKPLGIWLSIAVYSTEQDHFTAVFDNISARRQAEGALGESEARERERAEELAAVLDAVPTPVIIVHDRESTHMTGNRAADELLKQSRGSEISLSAPTEVKPHHFKAMKDGHELRLDELPAQRAARGEHIRDFEFNLVFDNGATRHLLGYGTPLLDEEGRPRGAVHVLVDITERKRAEEALRLSEEKFATAFANNPAAIAMTRLEDGLFLEVNDTWLALNGYRRDEVIGLSSRNLPIWPNAAAATRFVQELRENGILHGWEQEFRKKSGEIFVAQLSSQLLTVQGEQVILSTLVDITDRKKAETVLRESEEQFRTLADSIPNLSWWANADGYITWYNRQWYEYTGTTPEQMEGWGWQSVHDPNVLPKVLERWQASLATGQPFDMEFPLRGADGVFRSFLTRVLPLKDSAGVVLRWFGTNTDISALKQVEESLRQSEEKYRTLFTSVSEGFTLNRALYDETGKLYDLRVLEANPAAEKANGLTRDEFVGKTWRELWPGAEEYWWDSCNKVMQNNEEVRLENYAKVHDRWYGVHHFKAGPDLMGSIFTDITARKKAEETLRSAHDELKRRSYELAAVNRELEEFSYSVSHDLRAPLRTIEGFTGAILEDYGASLDGAAKGYFNRVVSASRRMAQLIDALLNMARQTKVELRENTVDLSGLAEIAVHALRKRDPGRTVDISIGKDLKARGDRDMLTTVIENLLDNAWKFTGRHSTAKIEFGALDKDGTKIFFIKDDGAGFDMQFAQKMFMPFRRLHAESEFPGLGMGLAIAYRIILRHEGRIWAESEPEKGATFYFTL